MKSIVLLGSTGSIGVQTLEVCRIHKIKVKALSANKNTKLLECQAREFLPESVCVYSESAYEDIKQRLADTNIKIYSGMNGLLALSRIKCDKVVNAVVGMVGLLPTLEAADAGNDIALANKETLVAGGRLITERCEERGVKIFPIDSEHSAIFQCLLGAQGNVPKKILLTASGGPFFGKSREELKYVKKEQALRHPNWTMGAKITVDSATLMNKGLELIEAVRLFDVKPEQVEIVVHRESVIHSAVEFDDGAIIAQLGTADMRIPIQFALTYPKRLISPAKSLSLKEIGSLTFASADEETFSCLSAAKKAISMDGNAPCIINSANEAAVKLFLDEKIGFLDISEAVNGALENVEFKSDPNIDDILRTQKESEDYVFSRFL